MMNGIDGSVGGAGGLEPGKPLQPAGATPPADAGAFADRLAELGEAERTASPEPGGTDLANLGDVIRRGRAEGLGEGDILREVVADEVRRALGHDVEAATIQAVQDAVATRKPLEECFQRLLGRL